MYVLLIGITYILLTLVPYNDQHWISSGMGSFGKWQPAVRCPADQVIIAFALLSDQPRKNGYDTAGAIHFNAYCGNPYDQHYSSTTDKAVRYCPKGYAVRGIQTQVEEWRGGEDDTALNNIDLDCHEVESPKINSSCTHHFKTLFEHSNSGRLIRMKKK